MSGGPSLALLARLADATTWAGKVREYEPDPWGYLRRKLESTEGPFGELRRAQYEEARAGLLRELEEPFLKPGALVDYKEVFERLLSAADFADLSFHLAPGGDPKSRRDGVEQVLANARPRTFFDIEKLPAERRPKEWERLVAQMTERLGLDRLGAILAREPRTPRRLNMAARRIRKTLAEYLAVTRHEQGARDELSPFVLTRLEGVTAAVLRFVA